MNHWEIYEAWVRRQAEEQGWLEIVCEEQLAFARPIVERNLPVFRSVRELGVFVGCPGSMLYVISNHIDEYYREFTIPKKNGGVRIIREPLEPLKSIQRRILSGILSPLPASPFAKAYMKGQSVKENAFYHRHQAIVMTLDIHSYFDSFSFGRVLHLFRSLGYEKPAAVMLAKLVTLDGALPQGAPTSPALSNLLTIDMDWRIADRVLPLGINYTRYADDMTFSGSFAPGRVLSLVEHVVQGYGFELNPEKTRIRRQGERQEVTGIVVNEKLQISRKKRRQLRQEMYYIRRYGAASHMHRRLKADAPSPWIGTKDYLRHLLGIAEFGLFVNPGDKELRQTAEELRRYLKEENAFSM